MKKNMCAVSALFAAVSAAVLCGCSERVVKIKFDDFYADGGDGLAAMAKIMEDVKALGGKPAVVEFSDREYVFPKSEKLGWLFEINGVKNLTIEGNGARVSIDPYNTFAAVAGSQNIAIRNFTTRYSKKDFTQGVIKEVNAAEGYFTFKVQKGYPLLPSDEFLKKNSARGWAWASIFDPAKRELKRGAVNHVVFISKAERLSVEGEYKIYPDSRYAGILKETKAGDRYAMSVFFETNPYFKKRSGGGSHVSAIRSDNVLFENIKILGVKGMTADGHCLGFGGFRNEGPIVIRGCAITYRDDGDLISGVIDGIHFKNNRVGPHIENCRIEGIMDDSINISCAPARILKVLGANKYKIMRIETIKEGTTLGVYYADSGKWLEGIKVVAMKGDVIETDKPIPNVVEWTPISTLKYNTPEVYKNKRMTGLYDMQYLCANFKISGNYFGPQRRYAAVVRANNGVIENNILEDLTVGIWISNEAGSWYEGPIPHDILVKGNTFKNIWKKSAVVDAVNAEKKLVSALKNISFVDNVFYLSETSGNVAVLVSNGERTSFRGNRYFGKGGAVIPEAEAVKVVPPATVEF